jgi:competence protein ComEA
VKAALALLLVVNLNTATIEELDKLPGVGPVLARRIVEFREKKGGFRRVEELLAVPGISERRWQELRKLVTASPPGPSKRRYE